MTKDTTRLNPNKTACLIEGYRDAQPSHTDPLGQYPTPRIVIEDFNRRVELELDDEVLDLLISVLKRVRDDEGECVYREARESHTRFVSTLRREQEERRKALSVLNERPSVTVRV